MLRILFFVSLLFAGLVKTAISGEQIRALAGVGLHAIEHSANGSGISDIFLVRAVSQDQTLVIKRAISGWKLINPS